MDDFLIETRNGDVFANSPPLRVDTPNIHINNQDIAMIDFRDIEFNNLRVTFKTSDSVEHAVRGRQAQAICWLYERQGRGVTSQEMSSWALRLSAYVFILKHEHNVNIRTDREPHKGGSHGRYVLVSQVDILKVEDLSK